MLKLLKLKKKAIWKYIKKKYKMTKAHTIIKQTKT